MLATKSKPGAQTAPAKSWRNYYRTYCVLHMGYLGHWSPGINPGPAFFPSQDVAESHARAYLAGFNPPGRLFLEFVGAFPEDGAAN